MQTAAFDPPPSFRPFFSLLAAQAASFSAGTMPLGSKADMPASPHSDSDRLSALHPTLARRRGLCGLGRRFVQGWGAWLHDDRGGRFLDFHGQMGELPLGHNAPVIRRVVEQAMRDGLPALLQNDRATYADDLADALARHTGMERCLFTSSGAEAVAAALRLARARTRRPIVLHAADDTSYRAGPPPLDTGLVPVRIGDRDELLTALRRESGRVAALLVAPLGRAGTVADLAPGYLTAARELCDEHRVLLIVDEKQIGLGRSGRLLVAEYEGVQADLLALGAGLGGGVFKLRALLGRAEIWDDELLVCSSPSPRSGPNNLACRVGLTVLHALVDGELCRNAEVHGLYLRRQLEALHLRYPAAVAAVHGCGLYHAVELRPPAEEHGLFFAYASHQGLLAFLTAAAAATRSAVLLRPSSGGAPVLTVTPPLTVTREELDLAIHALSDVCQVLAAGDSAELARAIGATHPRHLRPAPVHEPRVRWHVPASAAAPQQPTFAFVAHYTDLADVLHNDPPLAALREEELSAFTGFAAALPIGIAMQRKTVRSATGAEAEAILLGLPLLPAHLSRLGRGRVGAELQRAVDQAARLGAQVVGLGGVLARYCQNGRAVSGRGPAITTGHTLAAVTAVQAVEAVRGDDWRSTRVAVVGAAGALGKLCARLIGRKRPALLSLVATSSRDARQLPALLAELSRLCGAAARLGGRAELAAHDVVFTAVGAARPALEGASLSPGTLVCDVARPQDTPWHMRVRSDLRVIDGGLVALPERSLRFGVGNLYGLPAGIQTPDLAETMLLALAGVRSDTSVGEQLTLSTADRIVELARTHGFAFAAPLRNGQPARVPIRRQQGPTKKLL